MPRGQPLTGTEPHSLSRGHRHPSAPAQAPARCPDAHHAPSLAGTPAEQAGCLSWLLEMTRVEGLPGGPQTQVPTSWTRASLADPSWAPAARIRMGFPPGSLTYKRQAPFVASWHLEPLPWWPNNLLCSLWVPHPEEAGAGLSRLLPFPEIQPPDPRQDPESQTKKGCHLAEQQWFWENSRRKLGAPPSSALLPRFLAPPSEIICFPLLPQCPLCCPTSLWCPACIVPSKIPPKITKAEKIF